MIAKTTYLTEGDAQTYFNGLLETNPWDEASSIDRSKALIQASSDIDKLSYVGQKLVYQQEHEFPRSFVDVQFDPNQIDNDNVPLYIKYAVCEQALAILDGWSVSEEIDGLSSVSVAYGDVKDTFNRTVVPMHLKCGLCPSAWQFIIPFIRDNRSIVLLRVESSITRQNRGRIAL